MWCPKCKTEYRPGITVCSDCGTPLVDWEPDDMVDLSTFTDRKTAEKVCSFVKESGIKNADLQHNDEDDTYTVFVPKKKARKAADLLNALMEGLAEEESSEEFKSGAEKEKPDAEEKSDAEDKSDEEENTASVSDEEPEGTKEHEEDRTDGKDPGNGDSSDDKNDEDEEESYDWDAEDDTEKNEGEQKDKDLEKLLESPEFEKEAEDSVGVSSEDEEDPKSLLYTSKEEYEKMDDRYRDEKFSGLTFIIFGILGAIYLILTKAGVLHITYNNIVFIVICVIFAAFIISGIRSVMKAARMKPEVAKEESRTREIKKWLTVNITPDIIDSWKDDSVSESENDLLILAHLRVVLVKKFEDEKVSYLEMIAEEFYEELSEEQ